MTTTYDTPHQFCEDCGGKAEVVDLHGYGEDRPKAQCLVRFISDWNTTVPISTCVKGVDSINLTISEEAQCANCGTYLVVPDAIKDPVVHDQPATEATDSQPAPLDFSAWAIYSTDEEAWWSNDQGWVDFASADTFSTPEAREVNLPDGPPLVLWVRLRDDDL